MTAFQELDVVRVVCLKEENRPFTGTAGCARAPAVGDVGTIVNMSRDGRGLIIEMADDDGYTIWLATFTSDEVAPHPS
jgi:hypothetical protein